MFMWGTLYQLCGEDDYVIGVYGEVTAWVGVYMVIVSLYMSKSINCKCIVAFVLLIIKQTTDHVQSRH